MREFLSGALWIAVYLAFVLAPVAAMRIGPHPPRLGFWRDLSLALGFAATAMMVVQFVLTARFQRLTAPYGIDVIYYFHRYLAVAAVALVVGHAAIVVVPDPFVLRSPVPHVVAALGALLALFALSATSLWRRRLRLDYDRWRRGHVVLAIVAVGLALAHVHGVGHYAAAPAPRALLAALAAGWIGLVLHVRVGKPLRMRRRPYRVASVTPERGDAWVLRVVPDGHAGMRFAPGQFAWMTLGASPFALREHPFSFSSAPEPGGGVEFTIKELGDFTRTIGRVPPGTVAWLDGPYGSFTIDRYPDASGFVFVAGGIGAAPMVSMLRALAARGDRRPVLFVHACGAWDRVPFREAVARLGDRLALRVVYVIEDPPEDWRGETGRITPELLRRHLPAGAAGTEYFVCGPGPMIQAVERALHAVGVPLARTHSELFDLV